MRWVLVLALPLLGVAFACAGDGVEAITARPVNVSVSTASFHDPSKNGATIAVEFRPTPSPTDVLALEVIDRSSDHVIAVLPLDRTQKQDSCFKPRPSAAWELFTIRGESADQLQLDSDQHELRLTIKRDSQQKRFLLDIPDMRCAVIE